MTNYSAQWQSLVHLSVEPKDALFNALSGDTSAAKRLSILGVAGPICPPTRLHGPLRSVPFFEWHAIGCASRPRPTVLTTLHSACTNSVLSMDTAGLAGLSLDRPASSPASLRFAHRDAQQRKRSALFQEVSNTPLHVVQDGSVGASCGNLAPVHKSHQANLF